MAAEIRGVASADRSPARKFTLRETAEIIFGANALTAALTARLPDEWAPDEVDPVNQARAVVTAFNLAWGGALEPRLQAALQTALVATARDAVPGAAPLTQLYEQTQISTWQENLLLGAPWVALAAQQAHIPPPAPPLTADERDARLAAFVVQTGRSRALPRPASPRSTRSS